VRPAKIGAQPPDWTRYDVVIFDAVSPAPPPAAGRYLYLDPSGPASPFPDRGQVRDPVPSELRRDHPLLRHLTLADLNIREARRLTVQPGDVVVAAALGVPLIVVRERTKLRLVALGFDLRRSDLPLRPTLPLLLANALDWLAGAPAPAHESSDLTLLSPHETDPGRTGAAGLPPPEPSPRSQRPALPFRSRPAVLFLFLAFALGLGEWWAHQRRWTS
jgi:Ca-activated chloride channel family protein